MLDPQHLGFRGSISSLIALGRIPLASEVPIWTLLGCIVSSQVFPNDIRLDGVGVGVGGVLRAFDWWAALQCMLVTWGTNVAINFGNEYFDWDLDHPGQVEAIKRDVEARRARGGAAGTAAGSSPQPDGVDASEEEKKENEKIMGNTTRIIHDGTFPKYVSLLCCAFWQLSLVGLILFSRSTDPALHTSVDPGSHWRSGYGGSPFRGLALHIGIICTLLSHSYVGPPLRLHYNGFGELVSALFLSPVAFVFGLVGHYTAVSGRAATWHDLVRATPKTSSSGFALDRQMWLLVGAFYTFEQARIFVMHVNDIEADRRGGKHTFVSRVGHTTARNLYVCFNLASLLLFTAFTASLVLPLTTMTLHPALRPFSAQKIPGMMLRAAGGVPLAGSAAKFFSIIWLVGLVVILAYSIPICAITIKSLTAEIPNNEKGKKGKSEPAARIPDVPIGKCAMLVSFQMLGTAAFLCLTSLLASFAGTFVETRTGGVVAI
jgi:1,4-dihydroxy-2-naphthoate octaprenyltransferase